jgi:hypothetical protein
MDPVHFFDDLIYILDMNWIILFLIVIVLKLESTKLVFDML